MNNKFYLNTLPGKYFELKSSSCKNCALCKAEKALMKALPDIRKGKNVKGFTVYRSKTSPLIEFNLKKRTVKFKKP